VPYVVVVYVTTTAQVQQLANRYIGDQDAGRTVGIYQVPPKGEHCRCIRNSKSGWTRSATKGYMVCAGCNKPTSMQRSGIGERLFHALGRNLFRQAPRLFKSGYAGN
jgi:hypothetical protein